MFPSRNVHHPGLLALLSLLPILSTLVSAANTNSTKPPAFFLVGDSTTAVQSADGGGWGTGFLSFVRSPPAWGLNKGHDGATTVSYVSGGDWANVTGLVAEYADEYDVYVTIQFGHNDEKPSANISLPSFQSNEAAMVTTIRSLGGTPLLVTSLTRRSFNSTTGLVIQDLANVTAAAIAAAAETNTTLLDLNAASTAYVDAIGDDAAQAYDLAGTSQTHLNDWGSVVFGRMVADLLLRAEPGLEPYFVPNRTLSYEIWHGIAA